MQELISRLKGELLEKDQALARLRDATEAEKAHAQARRSNVVVLAWAGVGPIHLVASVRAVKQGQWLSHLCNTGACVCGGSDEGRAGETHRGGESACACCGEHRLWELCLMRCLNDDRCASGARIDP